ncbi:hypothetical protein FOZ63_019169 [Perkinsus olseni]|uniref:Uncharacterized protein n=1 Tax=Perkinsus olseni TaxID=32597 RepID=A0A7J6TDW2_PEROL|nr:hypothetical protein FOZ60_011927 [Perkinsus olseni]KAF4743305.1 hypothetical protein FOZ63_019169 [Perkinsus olseni]
MDTTPPAGIFGTISILPTSTSLSKYALTCGSRVAALTSSVLPSSSTWRLGHRPVAIIGSSMPTPTPPSKISSKISPFQQRRSQLLRASFAAAVHPDETIELIPEGACPAGEQRAFSHASSIGSLPPPNGPHSITFADPVPSIRAGVHLSPFPRDSPRARLVLSFLARRTRLCSERGLSTQHTSHGRNTAEPVAETMLKQWLKRSFCDGLTRRCQPLLCHPGATPFAFAFAALPGLAIVTAPRP